MATVPILSSLQQYQAKPPSRISRNRIHIILKLKPPEKREDKRNGVSGRTYGRTGQGKEEGKAGRCIYMKLVGICSVGVM